MKNPISRLFDKLNENSVQYCVLRKYEGLPEVLNGDIDIMVNTADFEKVLKIVKELQFYFYPYTEPHYFFFRQVENVGLVKLDITKGNLPEVKKFKNFYVPKDGQDVRIYKSFKDKVKTRLRRIFRYVGRGRLVAIVGPDGSGKSTISEKVFEYLQDYPLKKELIYFGTKKKGRIMRLIDLVMKVCRVHINNLLGGVTITDRYIYLTFRNKPVINKIVIFIAPSPDRTYLMKVSPGKIIKRKNELSLAQIDELYNHYSKFKNIIEIDNEKNPEKIALLIINELLKINGKEIKT